MTLRDEIKEFGHAASKQMDHGDTDIKAAVVTDDGWAVVTTEGSRQHALRMLARIDTEKHAEVAD